MITDDDRRQTWERATAAYSALSDNERQRIATRFALADRIADAIEQGEISPFYRGKS